MFQINYAGILLLIRAVIKNIFFTELEVAQLATHSHPRFTNHATDTRPYKRERTTEEFDKKINGISLRWR